MRINISKITGVEIGVYLLTFGIIIYGKILGMQGYDVFYELVKEDGLAEWFTVVFLLGSAVIFGARVVRSYHQGNRKRLLISALAVLLFVFGAGEEISWGQRIFNFETSGFFEEYNYQGEMNLHNLELWGININKLIFSKLMFIALAFYFIVLPFLVWKWNWMRKQVIEFAVPLPRLHHVIALLAQNAIVLSIGLLREGELHELSLTSILFLVFLAPARQVFGVPLEENSKE